MAIEEVEGVPNSSHTESFPEDAKDLPELYRLLLWSLGMALLLLITALGLLTVFDKEVPDAIPVLAGTIGGGLVGVLSKPSEGK